MKHDRIANRHSIDDARVRKPSARRHGSVRPDSIRAAKVLSFQIARMFYNNCQALNFSSLQIQPKIP